MFGDSRSVSISTGAEIDSRTSFRRPARGPLNWWGGLYGYRADIGAAGQAAAMSSVYAAQWPTVRAVKPRVVIFLGVVNDLNADIATGADISVSDGHFAQSYFDRLRAFADEVRGWNGIPVFATEPLGAGTNQTARIAEAAKYDALITAYAASYALPVLNMRDLLRDPSSTASAILLKADHTQDGLHPNERGAYYLAVNGYAPILNPIFSVPDARSYLPAQSSTQMLANPYFTVATGGSVNAGITGSLPASWVIDLSGTAGHSATVTTEARGDGRGNNILVNYTISASGQTLRIRQDVTTALSAAMAAAPNGIRIRMTGEIEVPTPAMLGSVYCLLQATVNGTAVPTLIASMEMVSGNTKPGSDAAYTLRLRTPWYSFPAGTVLTACSARYVAIAQGAGAAVVKLGVTQFDAEAL